jgi:hypothetical protein
MECRGKTARIRRSANGDSSNADRRSPEARYGFANKRLDVRSAPSAFFRNRFLDSLFPDSLQLLILRRRKDSLQLRSSLSMDGSELFHLLHAGKRIIVFDRFKFWSLLLQNRHHLDLLFRRELELLRNRLRFCHLIVRLAGQSGRQDQYNKPGSEDRKSNGSFHERDHVWDRESVKTQMHAGGNRETSKATDRDQASENKYKRASPSPYADTWLSLTLNAEAIGALRRSTVDRRSSFSVHRESRNAQNSCFARARPILSLRYSSHYDAPRSITLPIFSYLRLCRSCRHWRLPSPC